MNIRTRSLMAVALATALAAPLAFAQTETTQDVLDQQEATDALPPQVNPDEVAEQGVDPRLPVADDVEDPMSAVPPPPPQVDAQASGEAHVAERSRWSDLDLDGDGRISAEEGRADAELRTGFEAMDADSDGFVSEAEFGASSGSDSAAGEDAEADADRKVDHDDHVDGVNDRDRMDDDGTGEGEMEADDSGSEPEPADDAESTDTDQR